jgi:flavin reductase (DIM6/NTAB) family NADH-FMN oxidoreductase RutF
MVLAAARKVEVGPEHWDNVFAPSSCLVMITTVSDRGTVNAAAYGTCTRVCHDPVYVAFTCGTLTDTCRNVQATGEFVVNVVPFEPEILDKVLKVGLPFKSEYNELEMVGLMSIPSTVVRPPRIVECRSHFELKVAWTHEWENRLMVVGKVVAVSIDEACLDPDGFIYWDKVKPAHYCGSRYQDQFVPANEPLRIDWDWRDLERRGIGAEQFRRAEAAPGNEQPAAADWRDRFRSKQRTLT